MTTKNNFIGYSIFSLALLASGCSTIIPGHPESRVVGTVTDSRAKPIANATVHLFGATRITDKNGCFVFSMPDASPRELEISADGFKPITGPALAGIHKVNVSITRVTLNAPSAIVWDEITDAQFELQAGKCVQ